MAAKLNKQPANYAKYLRDSATAQDKVGFINCAKMVFSSQFSDADVVEEAASRLWRFVNDYSWWSGQKTIDRGDFYVSVILNMLNLVNVSQGYVADIVNAYASDAKLRKLVSSIDGFTVNMNYYEAEPRKNYILPDEEIRNRSTDSKSKEETTIPKPERVRIKISGTDSLKEIKYRTFWRILRNAKMYRGWVQIFNCSNPQRKQKKRKSETGRCMVAPTCLALPLFQGFSRVETQKSTQAIVS